MLVLKFANTRSATNENELGSGSRSTIYGDGVSLKPYAELLTTVRAKAMETKDFSEVDRIKSALVEAGVEVRMSKAGVELSPAAGFDESKLAGLLD